MTDTVKMPEPIAWALSGEKRIRLTLMSMQDSEGWQGLYSQAKLKQYGDDRAREALEMAAKLAEVSGCSAPPRDNEFSGTSVNVVMLKVIKK